MNHYPGQYQFTVHPGLQHNESQFIQKNVEFTVCWFIVLKMNMYNLCFQFFPFERGRGISSNNSKKWD
jgi:hypothetical protein